MLISNHKTIKSGMIVYVCNPRILEAEKKIKKLKVTPRKHSEFKNSLSDQTQA